MRHPRAATAASSGLDTKMTPMIDVIFQLIIFFLCTTGFATRESILATELPPDGAVATEPAVTLDEIGPVRLEVLGAGEDVRYRVNRQPLANLETVLERLTQVARVAPATPLILDVGSAVAIGKVIEIYDGTLNAGITKIHFAAEHSLER